MTPPSLAARVRAGAQGRQRADAQSRRVIPPILMVFASLFPLFLVIFMVPMIIGDTRASANSPKRPRTRPGWIPELAGLSGNALIQTFLFHQFSLLLLLVPIVSATALATHAVIGEKQSKALEPLLATPI